MTRRFFAFMLAFLMLFSSVPTQVWADILPEDSALDAPIVDGAGETAGTGDDAEKTNLSESESEKTTSGTTGQGTTTGTTEQGTSSGTTEQGTSSGTAEQGTSSGTAEQGTTSGTAEQGITSGTTEQGTSSGAAEQGTSSGTTEQGTTSGTTEQGTTTGTTEQESSSVNNEETVKDHVHGKDCYDAEGELICTLEEHTHDDDCYNADGELICGVTLPSEMWGSFKLTRALTEPELTGAWAADTLAIAQSFEGYTQEMDEDGNPYTVFGAHFNDAANTSWNTHFIAYCLAQAGVDTNIFPVNIEDAEAWKNSLQTAGYYHAKDSGYTPVAGDLIFWSPWYPVSYQVGILTKPNRNLTADYGSQEGKVGIQNTWDADVMGYARIPNSDGTLQQTLSAKVYTDDTFVTEDSSVTAVVEGALPVNAEIRVYPVTVTAEQAAALGAIGDVIDAYGVKVFVNGVEYTGAINKPVSVKITSDAFGTGAAMMPYGLADMQKLSASLSGKTLNLNVKIPVTFALVGIVETTVTTAAELKAAVEVGVPTITLGDNITVDAANDNMTVSKTVKIELNGKTLTAAGDQALFNISSGGKLTMEDNGTETVAKSSGTDIGRPDSVDDAALGSVAKADNGKAVLTYYVTDSTVTNPNGATQETRYQYTVSAAGMVENKTTQPLFVVNGGTLDINGGVYTGNLDGAYSGRGIVQNSGTTNLNGGYLCGFKIAYDNLYWDGEQNNFGGAIRTTGGNLKIGAAVIAANEALSGAGVYARSTTVTMNNGVISGNKATGASGAEISDNGGPHFGGAGVYLGESSTITITGSDSYITNNSAPNANGYADGGAAIFARKQTAITINNGYITSNTTGGGGGAIRTIYGTERNYVNMPGDAVRQAVEMTIDINGGYICGNFCRYAEGGGVSINAGTGCWVTGGYINNNVTMTQRDWGGGGLFNANGSYLEIKNVLITENTAKGLGGGVGGCSTGDIHLAVTEGGALFDNTAMGQNWSGEGSQKREDKELAGENPNFDKDNADDYFCVHNSKVEAQMLGRGSCDWVGTCDDQRVVPPQRQVLEATKVMGLTSYAMDPGKAEARMAARAYINGNYSNVHGGGIMCNGVLDVGTPVEGPMPAWLEVEGTKVFQSSTPMTDGMFTFELLDAAQKVVTNGSNDAAGNIVFGQQLVFETSGTHTYVIREKAGTNPEITYDDTVYTLKVVTSTDKLGNICIKSITVDDGKTETNIDIADESFYITLPNSAITFTNSADDIDDKPASVHVSGRKVWVDGENADATRPDSITVTLYVGEGEKRIQVGQQVVIGPNWEFSFDVTDLENLESAVFTIEENDIDGYSKEIKNPSLVFNAPSNVGGWEDKTPCKELLHDNVHGKTIVVAKSTNNKAVIWSSEALADYEREILKANLLRDIKELKGSTKEFVFLSGLGTSSAYGIAVSETKLEFADPSVWSMFWLGEFDRGTAAGTEAVITNTLTNMVVQAHKVWEDDYNRDGKRPATVKVELLADGKATGKVLELSNRDSTTNSNNWHGEFKNLPVYDAAGRKIEYTVREVTVPAGYTVSYSTDQHVGSLIITNTHQPEETSVTATKVWADNNDQDGKRPGSIVLTLYADGVPYVDANGNGRTVTLSGEGNTWTAEISDLPKYKNIGGAVSEIEYSFEENIVPDGYTETAEGTTVTNTHIPEETQVSFQKAWVDGDDQDGKRPDFITVNLLANGTEVQEMTVGEANSYRGTFAKLAKYQDGVEIVYTITEDPVKDYTTIITGDAAKGFLITNTHETEKTELSVKKVWKDYNNQDNKRTQGVVVALYGNDKETALKTVTLNAANGWTHTWEDLDLYAGGNYVDYSIVEIGYVDAVGTTVYGNPDGYTVTHAYNNADDSIIWTEATVTNILTPELTALNIQKEWDDNNNQDGIRPESITLTLWKTTTKPGESDTIYVNGHAHYIVNPSEEGGWVKAVNSENEPYVLTMNPTEDGAWDADFEKLPKYEAGKRIYYAVTEEAIEGYTPTYELAPGTNVLYIKNTHKTEKTEVSVFKTWDDSNNQDGMRPASITVKLYGRDKRNPLSTITLPDANGNWSYNWTGLDKNYNGKPIEYTVVETAVPGYNVNAQGVAQEVTATADASGKIVLNNTHVPATTSISVYKEWDDAQNQDDKRPDTITVELIADGQKTGKTLTLSAATNWHGIFTNLPVNQEKTGSTELTKPIKYEIWEEAVAEYNEDSNGVAQPQTVAVHNGVVKLINKHNTEVVSVTANKIWDDNNDQDGKRPEFITLHLLADGEHTNQKAELRPDVNGNWSYTWNNLPKYSDGKEVEYGIVEERVADGYTSSVDGFTVTNTYSPEKTYITVLKHWTDGNNQDGVRPASVTVELLANGQPTGKILTLNEANRWYGSFTDLDKKADGVDIQYTVQESEVEGYKPGVVSGTMAEGFIIENTREVEKTQISVSKVWDDANDRDGKRPESVEVTLYRDGVAYDTVQLKPDAYGNWTHKWENLYVHRSKGTKYVYSVKETVPANYESSVSGSAANGYVITNKRDFDKTSIPVIKVWDDAGNQDGKRPSSITVELLADGMPTGQTLTLSAGVNWRGAFTDLPVHREKVDSTCLTMPIVYTVREETVSGYTLSISGDADTGYTLTNTYETEKANLNVQKVWSDFNDKEKARPYAVVVTLHENGKRTDKTLTLSSENGWHGVWKDMSRYSGGTRIAYTVVETGFYRTAEDLANGNLTVGIPSGYMVSHKYNRTDISNPVGIITNTYAPETIGLDVQKRWNDDNNREGIRPKEITVTLYRKVGEMGNWEVVKDDNGGDPLTTVLNEANQWDADFLGLPKKDIHGTLIYYNVVEENVPEGYEASYKLDSSTGVVTITNTHEINKNVRIGVSKVWEDKDNQDNIRPAEIVVTLYANGIKTSSTKTLNESNGWKAEWTGLYEYYKGKKITYTVVEENVPEGYEAIVTGDKSTGFVITNTHKAETVDIPVLKIWDDNNNKDGIRPASITVTLFANGQRTSRVLTLDAKHLWRGTFADLEKYENGEEIKYSVQEAAVNGYNVNEAGEPQTQMVEVVDGKITLTNVHVPEKTKLTAIKKWHDNNDQDGKRPDSVTVHLLANGIHMGQGYTCVLNEENGWTYTWENLEKYVSGELIRYTVYEEPVAFKTSDAVTAEAEPVPLRYDHYVADYVQDSETQITINNRYKPETTVVKAVKVWDDDNNRDGMRDASVSVVLLANNQQTGKAMKLEESNQWTAIWTNLPKYENHGKLIEYTVKEVRIPSGYNSVVTKDPEDATALILTNTHVPVTTGVKVTKTWRDDNNNDGMRPDGLIVQLYANGSAVAGGRVILNDANGWKHTFQSTKEMPLYVYNHGKMITYYVQEIGYVSDGVEYSGMPDGYVGNTSLGENSYSIEITNTRASAKIALCVNKVWEDGSDADGVRPTSIQVTLLKNGTEVETVTLNKQNSWSYTWNDLYKYAGGVEVEYTVRETAVDHYTVGYTYTASDDGKTIHATVTNSYTPGSQWVTIQKVWKDNHNAEGLRPSAVTVQLYKNGDAYGDPIVLTAAKNWQAQVLLPKYENGAEIEWTIKEVNVPRHYTASYDQDTLTVTNRIRSKEVPRTGDENNLPLWFGLLGLCGAGAGAVLFADKKKKRSK